MTSHLLACNRYPNNPGKRLSAADGSPTIMIVVAGTIVQLPSDEHRGITVFSDSSEKPIVVVRIMFIIMPARTAESPAGPRAA